MQKGKIFEVITESPSDLLVNHRRLGHDSNQLLVDIMERWGGTKAFADSMLVEFQAAKPGSLIRQNLLEMIQKLVVNNTNHNHTRISRPSDLDDEELEAELQDIMQRAVAFQNERAILAPKVHEAQWQKEQPPVDD